MKEASPWIYQGVLVNESAVGFPDLLKKTPGSSTLGNYTYVPIDVKGHKQVTKKDRYQLLGYASLLESVLGYRPDKAGIWLNTGEIAKVDLCIDAEDFETLFSHMDRIRDGEAVTKGYRCGECGTCEWIDHCFSVWEKNDSVCLLYGVTGAMAQRFTKGSRKNNFADFALGFGSDLVDPIEQNRRNSRLFRGFCE